MITTEKGKVIVSPVPEAFGEDSEIGDYVAEDKVLYPTTEKIKCLQ
ncbi:hypothetical protein [Methanolobus profundi]|uniref:Uncharacterized protein n=1 Tax=Methanolobus profundi TaxID=487685 RepID=A0A1I4RCZ2_9EURY|nr:hypothetical protein [Methanolobus profundi]SFM49803.1 hypothetical protein SAMN04488696_1492 [Methanolobus profundi]